MLNPAPDVKNQPHLVTEVWRTYVIEANVMLVCVLPGSGKIRVTTPLMVSDLTEQRFETASGRVYHCVGPMSPDTHTFRMALFLAGLIHDLYSLTGIPRSVQ